MLTWTQEPRLYDDGNGRHWWPYPSNFDFERGVNDVSKADRLMGAVFGRRSDDKLLFVSMEVPLDASDELKAWKVDKAIKKIDLFLTEECKCERFRFCELHQKLYGPVIEEGDMIPQC